MVLKKMTINLSQVILDFDVKTELTSTYDLVSLVEMTVHLKLNLCFINRHLKKNG